METSIKTNGLILRRRASHEYHGKIIAFTKQYGKMRLTAMGLYKPSAKLSSALISGNLVYLTLSKGRRWHITGAKTIKAYSSKLIEPRLLYLSSIVRELMTELFPDEDTNNEIYEKAIECFNLITSQKHSLSTKELIVYRFMLAAFSSQGLLPNFTKCAREGRVLKNDEKRYWKNGLGILCELCKGKERGEAIQLPVSITKVESYTTRDALSRDERLAITTMVQDIYSLGHKERLESLFVWQESL